MRLALLFVLLLSPAVAVAQTRADCLREFTPKFGQSGKDAVWEPSSDSMVAAMLNMADVTSSDRLVDLGAGDGKIAIAAARDFGATAVGIEYNADLARLAQCNVRAEGLTERVRIIEGDVFREDFSGASVVTLYMPTEVNLCVRHRLLAMKPGTRVVSHLFPMGFWDPDQTIEVERHPVYLWIVPAPAAGTWSFRKGAAGEEHFRVSLVQSFQKIGGEAAVGKRRYPLVGAWMRGDRVVFSFIDEKDVVWNFRGRVQGAAMSGRLGVSGTKEAAISGRLLGAPGRMPWAEMAGNCRRYYD